MIAPITQQDAEAIYGGWDIPTGDPVLTSVRERLQDQHDRLIDAMDASDGFHAPMIRHYLAKVRWAMSEPPQAQIACRGMFFENGWGPAVDDVVRTALRANPTMGART